MASTAATFPLPSPTQNFLSKIKVPKFTVEIRKKFVPPICCSILNHNNNNAGLFEAAKQTVDTYMKSGMVIALGSGPASCMAIQYLGQQLRLGTIRNIVGIPTSVGSASEAEKAGITLDEFQDSSQIDIAFYDADVIEEGTLAAVIGRRRLLAEESLLEEKTILEVAKKLVFVITEKQYKRFLEGSIPVLVNSVNWMEPAEEIDDLFVGDAEVWRRPSIGHADPLGGNFPLLTKDGHNVLDVIFTSPIPSLAEVAERLDQLDGVVEHGIIANIPCTVVISSEAGFRIVENTQLRKEAR